MVESRGARWFLRVGAAVVLAFIYFPLVIVTLYAFNANITQSWPIEHWTTEWFSVAFHDEDVRNAFFLSLKAAFFATLVALVLGSLLAFALSRFSFFGQNALTFLVVLPIALPGIVTGIALNATITTVLEPIGISFGLATIVDRPRDVLHRARLQQRRRAAFDGLRGRFDEASSDLGADSWTTFRRVILPLDAHLAHGRWVARVRALLRRGHRHRLHVRGRADTADLDLDERREAAGAADRERRRVRRRPHLDHPGVRGAAARWAGGEAREGRTVGLAEP